MSYWATEIEGKSRMKNILGGDTLYSILYVSVLLQDVLLFMLIMSAMRHFTVLKAWKHTGLAKLDSSMQAYGKEQGPQRIARLILHHS